MEQREEIAKESQNRATAELGIRTADLYAIFQDIIKNLWMVLLVAISAAFLTYVGAYMLYQPEYRSSTTFVVSAKASSTGAYASEPDSEDGRSIQDDSGQRCVEEKSCGTVGKAHF